MGKQKTVFICSACGHREPKWSGRCPECGEWNSYAESADQITGSGRKKTLNTLTLPLASIVQPETVRMHTGISEMDRVLGGGVIRGSSVLIGGEPGIGKSTLMLQAAAGFDSKGRVLYISGEESAAQIKMRTDRLSLTDTRIEVLTETGLSAILTALESVKPVLVIVDSIQTLVSEDLGPVPGTVNQIKYCSHELITWARDHDAALFLVAHVTKEGTIAGPKVMEHMVDTVVYFEQAENEVRIIRAVKNRFGAVSEIGLFIMDETGLKQVTDPSSFFMIRRESGMPPGVTIASVYEGSRILLVEIQALVVPSKGGYSRVFSERMDSNKISRIAAVLEKHIGLKFSDMDMYVHVAGGIRLTEVGIDLPLAFALYSARTDLPMPEGVALAGEISLAGEVRPVQHLKRRAAAASDLGFGRFVSPEKITGIKEIVGRVFSDGNNAGHVHGGN
ncbi:MAG: DNA repair protein RadA [Spirochaetales bacterium]|nr:MAG: DNA repair protein RadA [Spirochaetales bacterium]